jgi:outer membrane protein TolC
MKRGLFLSGLLVLLVCGRAGADPVVLTAADIGRLAARNSLDVQLALYSQRIAATGEGQARSVLDAYLTADAGYRSNDSRKLSSSSALDNRDHEYSLEAQKKLSSGTSLDMGVSSNRLWSDLNGLNHEQVYGLTVVQDLGRNFFGRADRAGIALAQVETGLAELGASRQVELKIAEVIAAYWQWVFSLEQRSIEGALEVQAARLHAVQKEKLRTGLAETGDVAAARAHLVSRTSDLALARHASESNEQVLKFLLNLDHNAPAMSPADTLFPEKFEVSEAQLLKKAFRERRDYLSALRAVQARDLSLVVARDGMLPVVNLKASLLRNGLGEDFPEAADDGAANSNDDFFVGFSVKVPLQNSAARSRAERARLEKATALLQLKQAERRIILEVHDQIRACRVYFEAARAEAEAADLQAQKLAEEEKKFARGRSSIDTIIRYQQDLLAARLKMAQSALRFRLAQVELELREGAILPAYWQGVTGEKL